MNGASQPKRTQAGSNITPKYSDLLSHSRPSVRCRKTCREKILLQCPEDSAEKAGRLSSASSLLPANGIRYAKMIGRYAFDALPLEGTSSSCMSHADRQEAAPWPKQASDDLALSTVGSCCGSDGRHR